MTTNASKCLPAYPTGDYKRLPSLPHPRSDYSYHNFLSDDALYLAAPTMNSRSTTSYSGCTAKSLLPPTPLHCMSPSTVYQTLHRIGQTFSHVQYAVCGTAAMAAYGFTARLPKHVSIVCPAYAKDVMVPWAAAVGMTTYPSEPDTIGVTVGGSSSSSSRSETWKVYIKYVDMDEDHRFERLETVSMAFGHDGVATKVLTMPALVNQYAAAYIDERIAGSWRYRKRLADNVAWLLERMSLGDMQEHSLMGARIPSVRDPRFWLVFTTAHPETAGLVYDAGLRAEDKEFEHGGARRDWEEEEEDVWPQSSTSSHAPFLANVNESSVHGEQTATPRLASPRTHSRGHHEHETRTRYPSSHEPNLTRAEKRRVVMERMSRHARRRKWGNKRFSKMMVSLRDALDYLCHWRVPSWL